MSADAKTTDIQAIFKSMMHSQALNMQLVSVGEGRAVVSMPYDASLIGDSLTGVVHGGAVSALLDSSAGAAAISHPKVGPIAATMTLSINYMRAAKPHHTLVAEAHCYHVTRFVAFVKVNATDQGHDSPVAIANGTFTVGT